MKIKNKGKVYPSPSSSSSSSVGDNGDRNVLSALKLLPAAILALASVLSLEDREVLAYMIARSFKTTTTNNPSPSLQDSKKKSSKKPQNNNNNQRSNHIAPIFDCDCFDCYISYWFSNTTSHESSSSCSVADVVNVNVGCPDNGLSPEKVAEREEMEECVKLYDEVPEEVVVAETAAAAHGVAVGSHHKGLARKVLPDVLGLLNSRLWNLWSPNV
ncbi:hypothetical protein D5086_000543 [Populus alba]|uniref:Uncharacterized protein n=1 Tax=Populus alba TaxID=43335 RepID=A0ACC4CWM0_POPAL